MRNLVTSGHQPAFIASLKDAFNMTSRGSASRGGCKTARPSSSNLPTRRLSPPKSELEEIEGGSRSASSPTPASSTRSPIPGTYISFSGIAADQHRIVTRASLNLHRTGDSPRCLLATPEAPQYLLFAKFTDRQRAIGRSGADGTVGQNDRLPPWDIQRTRVRNHFRGIYQRLGIGKRSQLIAALKIAYRSTYVPST